VPKKFNKREAESCKLRKAHETIAEFDGWRQCEYCGTFVRSVLEERTKEPAEEELGSLEKMLRITKKWDDDKRGKKKGK
jgi:hypothetical protein